MSEAEDTPTHRVHQQQMSMARLRNWIELIRTNRAVVVEKVSRVKKATVDDSDKKLRRALKKIESLLQSAEDDVIAAAALLDENKSAIFEASDFKLMMEPTELATHGTEQDASSVGTGGDESEDSENADEASS